MMKTKAFLLLTLLALSALQEAHGETIYLRINRTFYRLRANAGCKVLLTPNLYYLMQYCVVGLTPNYSIEIGETATPSSRRSVNEICTDFFLFRFTSTFYYQNITLNYAESGGRLRSGTKECTLLA